MLKNRSKLPNRRLSETFMLEWGRQNTVFAVTVGFYSGCDGHPRGAPGEVFISGAKAGSDVDAAIRDNAVLISLGLQYGVPLEVMQKAMTREHDGTASTIAGRVVDLLAMTRDT